MERSRPTRSSKVSVLTGFTLEQRRRQKVIKRMQNLGHWLLFQPKHLRESVYKGLFFFCLYWINFVLALQWFHLGNRIAWYKRRNDWNKQSRRIKPFGHKNEWCFCRAAGFVVWVNLFSFFRCYINSFSSPLLLYFLFTISYSLHIPYQT